jgi:hypothetical protein
MIEPETTALEDTDSQFLCRKRKSNRYASWACTDNAQVRFNGRAVEILQIKKHADVVPLPGRVLSCATGAPSSATGSDAAFR